MRLPVLAEVLNVVQIKIPVQVQIEVLNVVQIKILVQVQIEVLNVVQIEVLNVVQIEVLVQVQREAQCLFVVGNEALHEDPDHHLPQQVHLVA